MNTDIYFSPIRTKPLAGQLSIPGSKSLTNRELVLSALSDTETILRKPLWSRDSELMLKALNQFGLEVTELAASGNYGSDLKLKPNKNLNPSEIDCGLAGTVMRFLPPIAGLAEGTSKFFGDGQAAQRPMLPIISALRQLGVEVADNGLGRLPFEVHGNGKIAGGALTIDASSSSQFISGLLLAAAKFETGLSLSHSGKVVPSTPHIDMTLKSIMDRGVVASRPNDLSWRVEPGIISGTEVLIEPDLSNAASFLIAPLILGGSVTILDWPETTTQVGALLPKLLEQFGATWELVGTSLTVFGGLGLNNGAKLPGVNLELSHAGELAPNLIALAALADEPSNITGIGHIRGHETDRIAAMITELSNIGAEVVELADGIAITPAKLAAGDRPWHSYHDHRIATSGAIISLHLPELGIENIATTAKTLPQFTELWERMLV